MKCHRWASVLPISFLKPPEHGGGPLNHLAVLTSSKTGETAVNSAAVSSCARRNNQVILNMTESSNRSSRNMAREEPQRWDLTNSVYLDTALKGTANLDLQHTYFPLLLLFIYLDCFVREPPRIRDIGVVYLLM